MGEQSTHVTTAEDLVGVVIVTHGQLARELLNATVAIVGEVPRFTAVSIGWHDEVETAREAIARAMERVDGGAGVLLLTDMFGGTPSNLALTFLDPGRVEVVTGVNLPMLVALARPAAGATFDARTRRLCEHGRASIRVASELLDGERRDGPEPW